MNNFKKFVSPLALAAVVAFAPATFADEQQPAATPTVDKTGNAKAMASCVADFSKQAIGKRLTEAHKKGALSSLNLDRTAMQQDVMGAMNDCAAKITGVPADQIPALPLSLPGPEATDQEIDNFIQAAEAFGQFMDQHVDELAFNKEMTKKYGEIIKFIVQKMEELDAAPQPKAPAPIPAPVR